MQIKTIEKIIMAPQMINRIFPRATIKPSAVKNQQYKTAI